MAEMNDGGGIKHVKHCTCEGRVTWVRCARARRQRLTKDAGGYTREGLCEGEKEIAIKACSYGRTCINKNRSRVITQRAKGRVLAV